MKRKLLFNDFHFIYIILIPALLLSSFCYGKNGTFLQKISHAEELAYTQELSYEDSFEISTEVQEITQNGELILSLTSDDFLRCGYEENDFVYVYIGEHPHRFLIPITNKNDLWGRDYINTGDQYVKIGRFNRNFAARENITLDKSISVTLSLAEKDGYHLDEITANRSDYKSDKVFANFRNVSGGKIGKNILFRSYNPMVKNKNKYGNRVKYADKLAKKYQIASILTLSETKEELKKQINSKKSPYSYKLLKKNQVSAVKIDGSYMSEDTFRNGIKKQMKYIANHKGPYLVHCAVGKDRTGFTICLLRALMGSSYEEITSDYVKSYENYNHLQKKTMMHTYLKDTVRDFIQEMNENSDVWQTSANMNLQMSARHYLKDILFLSQSEINRIIKNLKQNH